MWSHSHYIAQEVSTFTYAMCSVIIIFLGVVTPTHKSQWMRKGSYVNTGEKPVVLGEQWHAQPIKLTASCLSLASRRPKKKHRTANATEHTGCKQRTWISSKRGYRAQWRVTMVLSQHKELMDALISFLDIPWASVHGGQYLPQTWSFWTLATSWRWSHTDHIWDTLLPPIMASQLSPVSLRTDHVQLPDTADRWQLEAMSPFLPVCLWPEKEIGKRNFHFPEKAGRERGQIVSG